MTLIPADIFLDRAERLGIVPDLRYSAPKCLVYAGLDAESRWWDFPAAPDDLLRFMSHVAAGLQPFQSCWLWRRGGSWFSRDLLRNRLEAAQRWVMRGPPIPEGFEGAIGFCADDSVQMVQLATAHAIASSFSHDDLFIIPDHARFIVMRDHHDVVHVVARDAADMVRFIKHMAAGGYILPDDPRDWTFKRPNWMP